MLTSRFKSVLVYAVIAACVLFAGCSKKASPEGGGGLDTPEPDLTPPEQVTDLVALAQDTVIVLSWNASVSADVAGYKLYMSVDGGVIYDTGLDIGDVLTYEVTGLTNGQEYFFKITAYDAIPNESDPNDPNIFIVSAIPDVVAIDNTPPDPPVDLEVIPGDSEASFTWTGSPDDDVAGYRIYSSIDGGITYDAGVDVGAVTTYDYFGLTNGIAYVFHLVAYDESFNESEFLEASGTPGSAMIKALSYPPAGIYNSDTLTIELVNVTDPVNGEVYYSLDGTAPSLTGPLVYSQTGPITLTIPPTKSSNTISVKFLAAIGSNAGITRKEVFEIVPSSIYPANSFWKFSGMRKRRTAHASVTIPTGVEYVPGVEYTDVFLSGGFDSKTKFALDDGENYVMEFEHYERLNLASETMTDVRMDHTATLLNRQDIDGDGTDDWPVLILGGRVDDSPEGGVSSVALYSHTDRTFINPATTMTENRYMHTANKLYDGRVLVTCGVPTPSFTTAIYTGLNCNNSSGSMQTIKTPDVGTWVGVNYGDIVRVNHATGYTEYSVIITAVDATSTEWAFLSVVPLFAPAVGGDLFDIFYTSTTTNEIFNADGTNGTFTSGATITSSYARAGHQGTLLQNGTVLVTGGSYVTLDAEIYNPVTESFRALVGSSSMQYERFLHQATLLKDGRVLVTGGIDLGYSKVRGFGNLNSYYISGRNVRDTGEIFNPVTEKFELLKSMLVKKRFLHRATLLQDGTVLLTGGYSEIDVNDGHAVMLNTAEIFDPVALKFTVVGNMISERAEHTADLLPNGMVLISGGTPLNNPSELAELYNPVTKTFQATAHCLTANRIYSPNTLRLNDGDILVSGGAKNNTTGNEYDYQSLDCFSSAEVFNSKTLIFAPTVNAMSSERIFHSATTMDNGKILIAGGFDGLGPLATCDIYDPVLNVFMPTTTDMFNPRYKHTATKLLDGKILMTGGDSVYGALSSAELYDPLTGVFMTTVGNMNYPRADHAAVLLPDGRVLVMGGEGIFDNSTEIYDPIQQTFTFGPDMDYGRIGHRATPTTYCEGKAVFTLDSNEVTGEGTEWLTYAKSGDFMVSNSDGKIYVIDTVDSDIQVTLTENYTGVSTVGWDYYSVVKYNPLLLGGEVTNLQPEIYSYDTTLVTNGSFGLAGNDLTYGRYGHSLIPLNDTRVLVVGGEYPNAPLGAGIPGIAEIFTPLFTSAAVTGGTFGPPVLTDDFATSWQGTVKLNIGTALVIQGHGAQIFFPKISYP